MPVVALRSTRPMYCTSGLVAFICVSLPASAEVGTSAANNIRSAANMDLKTWWVGVAVFVAPI